MRLPNAATVWPPILATFGPGSRSAGHAHHAIHLVIAAKGKLRIRAGDATLEAPGIVTAPNVPHAIDATGCDVLLVFVDPESEAGARIGAFDGPFRAIDSRSRAAIMAERGDPMTWGARAVDRLAGLDRVARKVHPRVRAVLRHLRELPPDADTSLAELARFAKLSEGRLLHAFTESVGIPLRPYLLWLKLQRATVAIVTGEPLARAATTAGFADAAHMTRTFKKMFGMSPSALRAAR